MENDLKKTVYHFGTCCTFTFSYIVRFHVFVAWFGNIDGHKRDFNPNSNFRTKYIFY